MIRKKCGLIEWFEFDIFADIPTLQHGIFLRHGGISLCPFSSLNISYNVGDEEHSVASNLEKVSEITNVSTLVSSRQCHGKNIVEVQTHQPPTCDGLTTSRTQLGLLITHADCQAAILYDPIHHAVANVHCGWRGNVQNIYHETVSFMKMCYGSNPQDLIVGISPSLGPEQSEFIHYQKELPRSFWEYQIKPYHFDLWEISRSQLIQSGILPHHIEIAQVCTYENSQDFFSYRRDKTTGRHGTVVSLL